MNQSVNPNEANHLSERDIEDLLQTKQGFSDGKTAARDWEDIENDLNKEYDKAF